MVKYGNKCEYFGCGRWSQVDRHLSFFRFPAKSEKRCRDWALLMNRPDLLKLPVEKLRTRYVCARHFPPHAFMNDLRNRKTHDATPLPYCAPGQPTLPRIPYVVEFKPEMWEEEEKKTDLPIKRGRGRPRKTPKLDGALDKSFSEVVSCCALACPNTSENHTMITLPQDESSRKHWVDKIDRLDWSPDEDAALCEVHFEEDMWDKDSEAKKLLPEAVPSLFLHGEAIKSWVTLDNTGNIADMVVERHSTNDEDSAHGGSNYDNNEESMDCSEPDESASIFVKREALEPEIDMVEGCEEDMVPRDTSNGEQFETIYCDSTFNDNEDSNNVIYEDIEEDDISTAPNSSVVDMNPLADERCSSPIQDGEVSCLEDSTKKNADSKYLVISKSFQKLMNSKVIRRRTGNELTTKYQCPICDRRLSRKKNLEIHIQKLHPFGEMSEYQKKKKEGILTKSKESPINGFKKPPPPLRPIVPQCLISPSFPVIPLKTQNSPATTSAPEGVLTASIPILSFASQSPLVSSSVATTPSTIVAPLVTSHSLVTPSALLTSPNLTSSSAGTTLMTTTSVVTTPCPLDPSPAGGEMRKQQFLLLLPKPAVIPSPPPLNKAEPPKSSKPASPTKLSIPSDNMYSVNLGELSLERRIKLKEKLRELVNAVVKKNLNPERIIIAYDRT
ncbi:uncharacterized protein LOC128991020 isoform X2 [Macrosteles quadrilineatus]|uniref:uncharacterized protein LOC128991020 isoform X2 n=1 Tax=Macrosteles quadrilineatus TaxID=74068 RepID=UPI0023E2D350|nr:uncharacterized protein LOC128991020 isoform X2 [Macrosteles quadrilineatus]